MNAAEYTGPPPGPGRGERAADFVLPLASSGQKTRFYARAGGAPCLLVFPGDGPVELVEQLLVRLRQAGDRLTFGVTTQTLTAAALQHLDLLSY